MENQGEIILYQPDSEVKLEVRLEEETVWLTQEQIAILFGTKRPAITKHLNNIYNSGELDRESTCSILEHMGNDEKQKYVTKFYNLDAILSVGYRVNSRNAVATAPQQHRNSSETARRRRGLCPARRWFPAAQNVTIL